MSRLLVTGAGSVAGRALMELVHGDPEFQGRRFVLTTRQDADFSKPEEVEALRRRLNEGGELAGAALVAGANMDEPVATLDEAEWLRVWDVNFSAHAALLKGLDFEAGSPLVLVSSQVGFRGNAGQSAYAAAKGALLGLCHYAVGRGLRCNVLLPPLMDSPLLANLSEDARGRLFASRLLPDPSPARSFAEACLFLLSKRSSYIQGQVFHADSRVTALGWP